MVAKANYTAIMITIENIYEPEEPGIGKVLSKESILCQLCTYVYVVRPLCTLQSSDIVAHT